MVMPRSAIILDHCINSFRRLKMRVYLCSPFLHHDMDWAESIVAAEKGEPLKMLQLLKKDPDLIHTINAAGETVLHMLANAPLGDAITISTCSMIMKIVPGRLKSLLFKKNTNGDTPLLLALKEKHQELACWFIQVDSNVAFVSDKDGVYPSELAHKAGYSKVLEKIPCFVLHAGFSDMEIDLVRREFKSIDKPSTIRGWIDPIPKHARQAFRTAINGVIESSEIETYVNQNGGNILHWAARFSTVDIMQLLEKFMSKSEFASLAIERDRDGNLPLHLNLDYNGDKVTALYLIEVAPKAAYFPNRRGVSPLYLAIEQEREDLVREIFRLTPGIATDKSLRNSLLTIKISGVRAAVRHGNLGILEIIMNELPDSIDSLDARGWRPLSYAAYKGYLGVVSYFLSNFPHSVTKKDTDGSFPIHKAVGGGHVYIVEQFVSCFPSTIYQFDSKGRSILHIAVSYAKADVFSFLTNKNEVKEIFHHKDHEGKKFVDLV